MRPRRWAAAAWTALAVGCVPACVDLFHSTSDIRTACQIDASACAQPAGTPGDDASTLCAPPDAALAIARHACAWLGACASPMGFNAFGSCMVQATMAFDCAANPNHLAIGRVRDLWACLAQASSCPQVSECLFPQGVPPCSAAGTTACGGSPLDGAASTSTIRIECGSAAGEDGGAPSAEPSGEENCQLWGSICVSDGGSASCGNAAGLVCGTGEIVDICTPPSQVSWCGPNSEGALQAAWIDCAGNGAGRCNGFPSGGEAQWVSCVPSSDAGQAGACAPSLSVTCENGVARSCPTGESETVDCAAILGDPGNASACNAALRLDPPFDWTTPCGFLPSQCDADTCDGSILTSCARGASFSVDCRQENLGDCQMTYTDLQTQVRSKCGLL